MHYYLLLIKKSYSLQMSVAFFNNVIHDFLKTEKEKSDKNAVVTHANLLAQII